MAVSGGDKLEAALAEIARRVGSGAGVRVGFLEGATYPDGTSVPMVAASQNFGTSRIPPRPFFSNMIAEKSPAWGDQLGRVLKGANYDVPTALGRMGEGIAGQLRQSIVDTNAPPLAASTVARKGGTPTAAKPLIDTGHMFNSVSYEVTVGEDTQQFDFSPDTQGWQVRA